MNPFNYVSIAAREGRLAGVSESTLLYYASPEFFERTKLNGPSAQADLVGITRFMLHSVALDPRDATRARDFLASGFVCLQFFGCANPIAPFHVAVGGADHLALVQAFDKNLSGSLAKAVRRVKRQRDRQWVRSLLEDKLLQNYRDSLNWPDSAAFRANAEQARATQEALGAAVWEKTRQLRECHQRRMAALTRGAAPAFDNWFALITGITFAVLTPPQG